MGRRRVSFFGWLALLLIGALIALALSLLFPRQSVFENPDYQAKPFALSIAYLEVLLRSDSHNENLRLSLARSLAVTGQLDRAIKVLAPLLGQRPISDEVLAFHLDLQTKRLFAAPEGPERQARHDEVFASALRITRQPYELERIYNLIEPLSNWLSQPRYLALLNEIYSRAAKPEHRLQLAGDIARIEESLSRPEKAAATLRPLISLVPEAQQEDYIANLIRLELASGHPDEALELFQQNIQRPDMSDAQLDEGIKLAMLAGSPSNVRSWLQLRADRNPDNLAYQRELLTQQLAQGQLAGALETERRFKKIGKGLTVKDRTDMALVLDWNQRPKEALPLWVALYRETGSQQAFDRAISIASGIFHWDMLETLLIEQANREQLTEQDYLRLADTLISNGHFAGARQRLADGTTHYPHSDALRERQLTLLVNLREFPAAIEFLERQIALTDVQRIQLASLYWRTRQNERALETLEFQPDNDDLAETVAFMRLDLATNLGRTDILERDYRRLTELPDKNRTPGLRERLISLAVIFGDYPEALKLSEKRYDDTGDPNDLLAIAEYQLALERWQPLERTLDRWQESAPGAETTPRYWSLRALIHQFNGNSQGADDAYRRAWQLTPDDESLMVSWAWFKLSDGSQTDGSLRSLLARIASRPSTEAYPLLAYGYSALGDPQQAMHWFRQGLDTRDQDIDWLIATAELLEANGAPGDAANLRRRITTLIQETPATPTNRLAIFREVGLHRLSWQELAAFSRAAVAGRTGGEEPNGLREALGAFALTEGNAGVTEALVPAQASSSSLSSSRQADSVRQRMLQSLRPAPESREQFSERYLRQTERLNSPMPDDERQITLRDTTLLHRNHFNDALQLGTRRQSLGNFDIRETGLTGTFSHDDINWQASVHQFSADGGGWLNRTPESALEGLISIDKQDAQSIWSATAQSLPRYQSRDLALSITYDYQLTDRASLGAGYHWRERTPDSAEAWWLTRRNRAFVRAGYTPFSRLNLNAQLENLRVTSVHDKPLGDGLGLDLNATYTLFRNDPAWIVSAGYRKQQLDLENELPASVQAVLDLPLTTSAMITERYERIGVSTRWVHGEPGALFRSTPSPRFSLGIGAGFVTSTSTPDVALDFSLGWRVLGDDELALTGKWSSDSLGGSSRTKFNLTYTIFIGR